MPKVVYYVENEESNTLTHYGRLGMKWGQHIFGRDAVGHNVIKRLSKTEKKANKRLIKSQKYKKKSDKYSNPLIRTSISDDLYWKNVRKTQKYETKANKILDKGRKFAKKANEILGTDQLSKLSPKEINIGKRFALEFAKNKD